MPTFDWECAKGHQFELYQHTRSEGAPACVVELETKTLCGEATEKIWGITKRGGQGQYPYVTKHLTGQPIEITDAGHERRLMKEHGVRKRDDAAWATQEYNGYHYSDKQQHYKESGAGMPNCWV
jgi:hypothetical protein